VFCPDADGNMIDVDDSKAVRDNTGATLVARREVSVTFVCGMWHVV